MNKIRLEQDLSYTRNYIVTNDLTKSQYSIDYVPKQGDRNRFVKNNACTENLYIYSPDTKLLRYPPKTEAFGISETKNAFTSLSTSNRLTTNTDEFVQTCIFSEPPPVEPFHKEFEALDTTYEGFEKYLDPYLTTSRLHHRPYTTEQLNKISNSKDVITYHSLNELPWVRSRKPNMDKWRIQFSRHKSIYDREKFKEEYKEIRTHNKLNWTPGAFRTETKDHYKDFHQRPKLRISHFDLVQKYYQQATAQLRQK